MTGRSRIVGVLGGMGPAATIDFMAKVLRRSQATRPRGGGEQADVRLIVDSNPHVPDRNAAGEGTGESPGPVLAAMARGLERAGAELLVMPCNAAHAFAADVRAATDLPFIDMVDQTVRAVWREQPAARRVGVLAVSAAWRAGLYERAFGSFGIEVLALEDDNRERFMAGVWAIKAGDLATGREAVRATADGLLARGAEVIVAGCTEVPLVLDPSMLAVPLIDSTDVLAASTIAFARAEERSVHHSSQL